MTRRHTLRDAYQRLTPAERARTWLASLRAEREPDPDLFHTLAVGHEWEFARLTRVIDACDREGRALVLAGSRAVRELEAVAGWLGTLRLSAVLIEAAFPCDEPHDVPISPRIVRLATLVGARDPADAERPSLAAVLEARLRSTLREVWDELRAFDLVVDAFALDLGEDPLCDDVRDKLDDCLDLLRRLAAPSPVLPAGVDLREPAAASRELARQLVGLSDPK